MRLSTKGRYAVVAMIDLALRDHAGSVALSSISARQQVSLSYLEQLFGRLRRCQLVESSRGPGGGYALGRNPERITGPTSSGPSMMAMAPNSVLALGKASLE